VCDAFVAGERRVLALKGKRDDVTAWACRGHPGAAGLKRRLETSRW
jgi:hypothetical protein